jgi:hypothetical protein
MAYEPAVWAGALDRILGERRIREFSVTMVIGGKLRALYNEVELPSPSRLDELLAVLATGALTESAGASGADERGKG